MHLYHYFSKENGPFRSISDLPRERARAIWNEMIDHLEDTTQIDFKRDENKLIVHWHEIRQSIEADMRRQFAAKGGKTERLHPYYLVLSVDETPDKEMIAFYKAGDCLKIHVGELDMSTVSFTYCDSMQYITESWFDNETYGIEVFTYGEILGIVDQYGWKSEKVNQQNGKPRFIEAQLWSDEQIDVLLQRSIL